MVDDDRRGNSPQSVTRIIHILETMCTSPGPLSMGELSRALATPKSSMASLLRGLMDQDFVVSTPEGYRLGSAAFGLAASLLEARRGLQSSDLIRAGMSKLASLTNETLIFGVLDKIDYTITYVDVIESKNPVRYVVAIGDRRPLYCTSGGRAVLSAQSDDFVREYLRQLKPLKITTQTETDKRQLAYIVKAAREKGVACAQDQGAEDAAGISAAVYDATGFAMGALIVAMPSARLADNMTWLADLVAKEAASISRSLGHRPSGSL